ncbi:15974_t:CDS:2 [Funneliformis geosporum]|nr:15974_t:CDS:2 [Funneliformis geosporum]
MISQIVENWSDEEYEILRERLKNCIQFVRFDLINYGHLLQPSRPSPIDSFIINLKHAAFIASWVDRTSHPYRLASIPYQFRLLLRSTRDGFTAAEFHKKCDNFDKTVTVLRVKDTKEILGGYNPLNWNGSGYKSTSESFIFSFESMNEGKSFDVNNGFKLSRVRNHQVDTAIYSYANCGPQWGGNDLRAWGSFNADCCQCVHYRYEEAIRNNPDLFSAEEFEVFQLIKR